MKKLILIISCILLIYSCKKDKTPTPTTATSSTTPSVLIGKYVNSDADVLTRSTIYIYQTGSNCYMTCPDNNASSTQDTIGITISNLDVTIPTQYIYGTATTIVGHGSKVLSNQLNLTWSLPAYTKTDVIYIQQ